MDIRELRWFLANEALNLWRFRWLALAIAWVVGLGGWLYAIAMPDQYRA